MNPKALVKAKAHAAYWEDWMNEAPSSLQFDVLTRTMDEDELKVLIKKYQSARHDLPRSFRHKEVTEEEKELFKEWMRWEGGVNEFIKLKGFKTHTQFTSVIARVTRGIEINK